MNYDINWGGPGYATYEVEMKVSGQEKSAANMTSQESSFLMNMLQTQFSEQQNLLTKVMIPQLQGMATNPQGFGAQAMANIRAQTVQTIGSQLATQRQALQQQFATQNMAGLGSGVQAAISAQLGAGAVSEEASALQQQQIANAQLKAQQQQWALGTLGQIEPQLGAAPQAAGLLSSNLNNQFQQAYTMSQQGGFWSNLARGALSAAGTAFLGPLGGMAGNWLGNIITGAPTAASTATNIGAAGAGPYLGIGSGGSMPDPTGSGGLGIGAGMSIPPPLTGPIAPPSVSIGQSSSG